VTDVVTVLGPVPAVDYVLTGFVPRLRQAGLSDEQIQTLTVDNPRAALTGE